MSKVISIKKANLLKLGYEDFEDWIKDDKHVYIGRNMSFYVKGAIGSKWANPFSVKKYGRNKCIKMFKKYILKNNSLLNSLDELDGKILGCWCKEKSDIPCHGDVLVELLKKRKLLKNC
jgi:hypothetical protein